MPPEREAYEEANVAGGAWPTGFWEVMLRSSPPGPIATFAPWHTPSEITVVRDLGGLWWIWGCFGSPVLKVRDWGWESGSHFKEGKTV